MRGNTFGDQVAARAAGDYADFLLPHLGKETHLLDCGCGDGALTVGLANVCGRVTALDVSAEDFRAGAASHGLDDPDGPWRRCVAIRHPRQ